MKFDKKIVVSAALLCFAPIIYGFGRMVGGQRRIDTPNLETITSNLNEKIKTNLNGYNLACATTQVVAGSLNRYFFENGDGKKCCLEVWMQPWVSQQNPVSVKWKCNTKKVTSYFANCLSQSVEQTRKRRDLSAISSNDSIVEEKTIYDPDVKALFERFIAHYKRPYSELGSAPIYKRKYKVFEKNIKLVQELNKMEKGTAVYGITKFMDYSYEEFHTHMAPGFTKQLVSLRAADVSNIDSSSIPEAVDWRKQGAVTAVKNQGECGSCWAFSTTGNVEGQWFLRKGALLSLSEQELVDCDSLDQGCDGGLPANAYKSIEKLGGLEREKDYPYEGEDETCSVQQSAMRVYINDSLQLPTDEDKLAGWLAKNGPISIGINANLMQFYWGGISHPWKMFCNPKSLDHGVLIVGYGTEDGTPFWIIKNSWGPDWGEQGYYRIYRGDGSCGVNQMATSAVIN